MTNNTLDFITHNIESVLFEYSKEPITMICKDKLGRRYLLHYISDLEVLMIKVNKNMLINILEKKISIYHIFKNSKKVYYLIWRKFYGKKFFTIRNVYKHKSLPADLLPSSKFNISM